MRGAPGRVARAIIAGLALAVTLAVTGAGDPAAAQAPAPTLREHFASADKNGDGRIDREEFHIRVTEVFFLRDTNKDGYLVITEMEGVSAEAFRAADRNGDGRLSLQEYLNARAKDFAAADTDGDGVLVWEEIDVYFQRARR